MNKIEVAVIDTHSNPGGFMMFLAKLTQRGHNIKCMSDLKQLCEDSMKPAAATIERVAALPHGTIKRFTPITVAIVGASRRFLAQARTHPTGFNYVSASLQYSDYSGEADFVVPYELFDRPERESYLATCKNSMQYYKYLVEHGIGNDTAGYAAPQGLRNILIIQGNHEAWMNFIRSRSCSRNTNETQYVTLKIWEELLKTPDGEEMFRYAGPDCMFGACREGKMCCGSPLKRHEREARSLNISTPRHLINTMWPLLKEV